MSTEKQMKIVDAVAELGCEKVGYSISLCLTHVARVTEFNRMYDEGSFHFVTQFKDNKYWDLVCTIEEYNNCIEEMKYHYDIPRWCSYNRADKELLTVENSDQSFYEKEEFVHGQDVYVNTLAQSDVKYKFGCLSFSGKSACILLDEGYDYVLLENLSSKPIKAKEDQVIDMIRLYCDAYYDGDIKSFFNLMQENGDLAPIELEKE